MFQRLDRLIEEQKWEEARELLGMLEKTQEPSDRLAVYNAMVYLEEGRIDEARQCITVGMICNPSNYELYYLLGNSYLNQNINQAYLCYEQAFYYCTDHDAGTVLEENMSFIRSLDGFEVHPSSIVILSYHGIEILERCVESVRKTCAESMYELIVVDDSLDDSAGQWLKRQKDIVSRCNNRELSPAQGYNQGIALAGRSNDIFLLDSNSVIPPNAVFWLRMGLYERECTGAACPLSNSASNYQQIKIVLDTVEEYMKLAESIHMPMPNPYENKIYAVGSAMLIKRRAMDGVGVLDEQYKSVLEDLDYGMALSAAGYEILLCNNAFVYHDERLEGQRNAGGAAGRDEMYGRLVDKKRLVEKWGIDPAYYMNIRKDMAEEIKEEPDARFRVLEVGCGCGSTLSYIKWKYPNAEVYGIETVAKAARLGKYLADILIGNVETMEFPYVNQMFDYIFFGDVLEHLHNPQKVILDLKKYLRPNGRIYASIPNLLNGSVIAPLLRGEFTYKESGLLDKTHIHFFTRYEIEKMFWEAGFGIEKISANMIWEKDRMKEGDRELLEALCKLPGVVPKEEFEAYQYFIVAKPCS